MTYAGVSAGSSASLTKITTVTVANSSTATMDFTSIPGTYAHLKFIMSIRGNNASVADLVNMRFNGISTGQYVAVYNKFLGNAVTTTIPSSPTSLAVASAVGINQSPLMTAVEITIPLYSTAGNNKTFFSHSAHLGGSNTNWVPSYHTGYWTGTAAVTSISFFLASGDWIQSTSTATLYGLS